MSQADEKRTEPDLSLVVPLYNEAASLEELHRRLAAVVADQKLEAEFIFLDDGSTDDSWATLARLAGQDPRVKAVRFRKNFGKAAGLACGFQRARGKIVITMDADLQDNPEEIPKLLAELEAGPYDLVSGWKFPRRDPFLKRAPSKLFNLVNRVFSGVKLHDFNCGFKAYRRQVVKELDVYGELHRYLPILAARRGFRVGELKVEHHPRKHGRSKYGGKRFFRGLMDFLTVTFLTRYLKRPLHFFGFISLVLFLPGLTIDAYFVVRKLADYGGFSIWDRWPVFILGNLLLIIASQVLATGLVAELIVSTHHRKEDEYAVAEETGFSGGPPPPAA